MHILQDMILIAVVGFCLKKAFYEDMKNVLDFLQHFTFRTHFHI